MLFVSSYKLNYPKLKFLQEVMTQSNSPEHDFPFIALFPATYCLKKNQVYWALILHMFDQEFPT